jgi:endonuclease/exonuclease/phosphatase family metal-dependent hydrolase
MNLRSLIFCFFTILVIFAFGCNNEKNMTESMEIDVMSFNIRLDIDDGDNSWVYRKPIVEDYLNDLLPDIIGFQEPLENQVRDLDEMLEDYDWVGDGRDEDRDGEACPVFFNRNVFELLNYDTFWLSETPDIPGSMGPGAQFPRVVTWVELEHKPSNQTVFFFNTHFSHVSPEARAAASEIMSEKMENIAGDNLTIALGDFNFELDSDEYNNLTDFFHNRNNLVNVMDLADEVNMGETTFNGWRKDTQRIIDFIFISEDFESTIFQVDEIIRDGVFISDHWPLWATIRH